MQKRIRLSQICKIIFNPKLALADKQGLLDEAFAHSSQQSASLKRAKENLAQLKRQIAEEKSASEGRVGELT